MSHTPAAETTAISDIPSARVQQLDKLWARQPGLLVVRLFGSRAKGRQQLCSDNRLCLEGLALGYADRLRLIAAVGNWLLPWRTDLVLRQGLPAELEAHCSAGRALHLDCFGASKRNGTMTDLFCPSWLRPGSCLRACSTQKPRHLGAAEQGQAALESMSMIGGVVELVGKSASSKSISDSIQSSEACYFSSFFSHISLSGPRRQLSVAPKWRAVLGSSVKNERKRESDEQGAPLLWEGNDTPKEGDVGIGRKGRNQGNHQTFGGLNHNRRIEPKTGGGRSHRLTWTSIQVPRTTFRDIITPTISNKLAGS